MCRSAVIFAPGKLWIRQERAGSEMEWDIGHGRRALRKGNGTFSLRFGYFLPQYVFLMYLECIVKYFAKIRIDRRI